MKAVRWHAAGDVRIEDVTAPPAPARGVVQVSVLASGICGTDLEEFNTGPHFVAVEPHPLTQASAPLVLGHEFAGRIVAVGEGVDPDRVGELVAVSPDMSCGRCDWCRRGEGNLCEKLGSLGLAADGGLAELCNVPASCAVALGDNVAAEAGALIETLAVGHGALRRGRFRTGERVAIVGGGTVGLLAAQAAAELGAAEVKVVEVLSSRRDIARQIGITAVAPDAIGDVGADVVLECTGRPAGFVAAQQVAAHGGRVVIVGLHAVPVELDAMDLVARGLEVVGQLSYEFARDFVPAAQLMSAGRISVDPLVTARIRLDDVVDVGFRELNERPQAHIKIMVLPTREETG